MSIDNTAVDDHYSPPSNSDDDIICRICFMSKNESKAMKLIKPCLCNEYVHVTCLNQWRATSLNAYYKCTTCQYNYVLKRTIISEMIMSDNGVTIITSLILLLIVIITGLIIHTSTFRTFNINTARVIYDFLQINIDSMFRSPHYYKYKKDTWHHFFAILCYKYKYQLLDIIDPIIIGSCGIGSIGLCHYIYKEMEKAINQGHNEILHALGRLGMWIGTLSTRSFGRLAVSIGLVMAYINLFKFMSSFGKKIAQVIGETILEPNGSR